MHLSPKMRLQSRTVILNWSSNKTEVPRCAKVLHLKLIQEIAIVHSKLQQSGRPPASFIPTSQGKTIIAALACPSLIYSVDIFVSGDSFVRERMPGCLETLATLHKAPQPGSLASSFILEPKVRDTPIGRLSRSTVDKSILGVQRRQLAFLAATTAENTQLHLSN